MLFKRRVNARACNTSIDEDPERKPFDTNTWMVIAQGLTLSPRELQIVQHLFEDMKDSAIARSLGISVHTVRTHLERVFRKTNTSSRVMVVRVVFEAYLAIRARAAGVEPSNVASELASERQSEAGPHGPKQSELRLVRVSP